MFSFKNKGILGINARNLLYIKPYNKKKAIRMADDKIKTKQFLSARKIPVPKLYGVIKDTQELEKFDFNSLPESFVIKPNQGFGGEGIIPIINKKEKNFITANKKEITKEELKDHIRDILDGRYSISNIVDSAFLEQYIIADEKLRNFSYAGLPDIRVVVHNLIPVMAMLRLPTKESEGKANLHMGAIGVGIDIAKGQTTHLSYKNKIINKLPDNDEILKNFKIPYWDEILRIASEVQLITNLGYMAIDICIDKNTGPVLLEINARAGLGVQIANMAPLRKRLERIEGIKVINPTKGVRIAKDMFGNIVEKEIENISGRPVIKTEENVEIIQKQNTFKILAKVDTTSKISSIDENTAIKHNMLENTKIYDDEKSTLKLKFNLKNKRIQTIVNVEKISENSEHKMILGTRDLQDFFIETNQPNKKENNIKNKKNTNSILIKKKKNYSEIDQNLIQIDSKIKLLYHLRPINLEEEREKFLENPNKNPEFQYPELKFNSIDLVNELNKIETDNTTAGLLFEDKKQEISQKIELLESINEERFTEISKILFKSPNNEEVKKVEELLRKISYKEEEKIYSSEDAKEKFEKVFDKYNLKNWEVKIKENMVADCVAGKNNKLFINAGISFSRERIESLIVHEIETHILTAENGKKQPFELFNRGFANYLITQEGMAMYNVEKQRKIPFENNYKALANVLAIHTGLNSSFIDIFKKLIGFNIPKEQAFRSALKAKRGFQDTSKKGAFTKDYLYYKGYKEIKKFVENGGNIKDLYIGKINLNDLDKIKKIKGVIEPEILPKWF